MRLASTVVKKDVFCSKLDLSIFCLETTVLLDLTPFCDKNCVLLKFNHFWFENAFRIICRMRKTFLVLNWIFQYFDLKPASYVVLHNFVSKTAFCLNLTISCLKMRLASTVG